MKDDDLKRLLSDLPIPSPREEAEKEAIKQSLAVFEKKSASRTQGKGFLSRLMDTTTIDRSIFMNTRHLYAGTAAAMVLAVGVLSWDQFQDMKQDETLQLTSVSEPKRGEQIASFPKSSLNDTARESAVMPDTPLNPSEPIGNFLAPSSIQPVPPAPPPPVVADAANDAGADHVASAIGEAASSSSSDMSMNRMAAMEAPQAMIAPMPYAPDVYTMPQGNDQFKEVESNSVKLVSEEPVSTFSIDVDTASYAFVRRQLNYGQLPDASMVRIEEMINYFDYDYALPESKAVPFKPSITVAPSPWHKGNKLVHIGIKGFDVDKGETPRSNLVFLIDTSGSMYEQDKLPLLLSSLKLLVNHLDKDDTVSIVTYAGGAGVELKPTQISDKEKIFAVLNRLQAGGSTAGAAGIAEAYALAEKSFDKKGVNRVILATDGDFNVGITDPEELKKYVEQKRETGVFLSVIGFGEGNYNDLLMQELAQNGNGNAAYIDTIQEAQKVLVHEATSTLFPIAKDVKLQVEFNPTAVSEYRLIGYETRMLKREDFNNDKVDAGDIGAGHAVTAIYEITPKGAKGTVDPLRYGKKAEEKASSGNADEYGFLKIRYKLPKESKSRLITTAIDRALEVDSLRKASDDARFAISVAAFGQKLKQEAGLRDFSYTDIATLAKSGKGKDAFGYRHEFIKLVELASGLQAPQQNITPGVSDSVVVPAYEIPPGSRGNEGGVDYIQQQ